MSKVAIVTGATGIQGGPLLEVLQADERFAKVWAVSRRPLEFSGSKISKIKLDLMDKEAVANTLKDQNISGVTHIFHTAFSGDMTNLSTTVADMLSNVVEAVEETGSTLENVYTTLGGKYYGLHWGEPKTPYDEADPRHFGHDFYYDLEDSLIQRRAKGAKWTWSSLRPGVIVGWSKGSTMNLLTCIAAYGTLCKELGLKFRFPGSHTAYNTLTDTTDHKLLMEAAVYISTTPEAANNSYNISNGDTFRWSHVWPVLADWFGLEVGPPLPVPLEKLAAGYADEWAAIKKRHGLLDIELEEAVSWPFADATFGITCDNFSNTVKLRQVGFPLNVDSPNNWLQQLDHLADDIKFIPRYTPKTARKSSLVEAERQK